MASFGTCMVLAVIALACFLAVPGRTQQANYTTVGDCDEICPLSPDAVCKRDCLYVNTQGEGYDCIDHFYDSNGNIVYCWL